MIIWGAGYKNGHICELSGAGTASVATANGTSEIWFTKSGDAGATWSAPVLVGTLATGKAAQINQRTNGALIVTNGIDAVWSSDTFGRTWTAI